MSTYEPIIFISREVLIYQIPPLRSSKGYCASEWEVDKPLWRGRLRVLEIATDAAAGRVRCELRLEDNNTGELFASAPYFPTGKGVEQVTDSSRFFVIRVVDGERHAYLGMGFMERSEAFDFNIALQDFKRHANSSVEIIPTSGTQKKEDAKDYSLKEGQTITISLGKGAGRRRSPNRSSASEASTPVGGLPFLPPPPSAQQVKDQLRAAAHGTEEDDDFGDFVS
ncbi:hypothetical protein V1517DRAFT_316232 [Lipomyces orientalis]|uniref:Uncharacterized protein n=1 Tax=Lipomyces orientalis TaxID=1233043 RepID=A0ACC3TV28_9ASCO